MSATTANPADYAFNHWRKFESAQEHAERVEAAEIRAGLYFSKAVKPQLAVYNATMECLRAFHGPAWDRRRAAAQRVWKDTTAGARALFEITADEIMRDGEVSEATSLAWDVLEEQAEQQPAPPSFPTLLPASA